MAQRSEALGGAEAYPFDPNVRVEYERDLDRLRGFADRKLAAYLFELYALAVNNSANPLAATRPPIASFEVVRALAGRALAGQLGAEAQELAEGLLLDPTGRQRADESSLRIFARAYHALKRG